MTVGTRVWAAWLAAGWSLCYARAAAQTSGTLDVGVSTVRYDGFLPSGAVTVTPAVRWERSALGLGARGTYLRFESGHRSLQGAATAWLLVPRTSSRWQGELTVETGASRYLDFASFWHAVTAARLHLRGEERGAWLSGTAGATSYGATARPVAVAAGGAWRRLTTTTLQLSASRAQIGDTTYTDLQTSARAERSSVVLDATLGARVWSHGGGHGVYGDASAAIALSERSAVVLGGGRYPTDAVRGSLAARYLTAVLSIRIGAPRRFVLLDPATPRSANANDATSAVAVRLDVRTEPTGSVRLVVHAAAASVELAGDFTDWTPLALTSTGPGVWEAVLQIPSGLHRVNVRIDGAAWIVPAGTTAAHDDYDGKVGMFVVP